MINWEEFKIAVQKYNYNDLGDSVSYTYTDDMEFTYIFHKDHHISLIKNNEEFNVGKDIAYNDMFTIIQIVSNKYQ